VKVDSLGFRSIVILAALSITAPLCADFHLMRISEVLVGAGGDPRIQFVELQTTAVGQNFVGGHSLYFFDAAGNQVGRFTFPTNVANGANGAFILIGTAEFAAASSVAPDFTLPEAFLPPAGGRVSYEGPSISFAIDSLAYGAYTGVNTGYGTPAPAPMVAGNLSLTRTRTLFPPNNSTDYTLQAPSPTNNAGQRGVVTPPPPPAECPFRDDFHDLSNWDRPAPNAGVDLGTCLGSPTPDIRDIGTVEAIDNALVFRPGNAPSLPGINIPIAFTGMKNSVVSELGLGSANYRLKMELIARRGIVIAAVFVRQHYYFDEDLEAINIAQASGIGINFSFDGVTEARSDHLHADIRGPCLQAQRPDGEDEAHYDGFQLMSETPYTLILDVDGDDDAGPITLQVKLFPSDQKEPRFYLATFVRAFGLGAGLDEELDHGVLIAALGQTGAQMEVTHFEICDIPLDHKFVRSVNCFRHFDGSGNATVTWENPSDAEQTPITILVNGVEAGTVPGDATGFDVFDPPEGELRIGVRNYSGVTIECVLCGNAAPTAVISGPARGSLTDGTLVVRLDATGSDDGDGGSQTLGYFWQVIEQPAGASATLSDPSAEVVDLTVDQLGDYRVRLTVTDSGCAGDGLDALSASAVHTLRVTPAGVGFLRGDCNGDGQVRGQVTDAVFMLNFNFLGGATPPCFDACDANGDGAFRGTVTDAVYLLQFNFVGGPPPPAPFPACGPGEEVIGCAEPSCP
jgi:hypothetical protein